MIIDTIENLKKYVGINPLFADVVKFIEENDLSSMEDGKYTKAEYNAEKDITKYPDVPGSSYVTCRPGMMTIFFPQDGHAPCISYVPEFRKAIFKVKA